jgi:hypothetical protein
MPVSMPLTESEEEVPITLPSGIAVLTLAFTVKLVRSARLAQADTARMKIPICFFITDFRAATCLQLLLIIRHPFHKTLVGEHAPALGRMFLHCDGDLRM